MDLQTLYTTLAREVSELHAQVDLLLKITGAIGVAIAGQFVHKIFSHIFNNNGINRGRRSYDRK